MIISKVQSSEFPKLLNLWEVSVRASHTFLNDDDILFLKPIVMNDALPQVELRCVRNENNEILGFIGIAGTSVEMLFVSPEYFGQGIGKGLMRFSEKTFNTCLVDVNEQNPDALAFYKRLAYKVIGRSALDPQGKPFPILHLSRSPVAA